MSLHFYFFPRVSLYTNIDTDTHALLCALTPSATPVKPLRYIYIFQTCVVFFFVSRFGFKSERFDANNPPLVLDENSAKSSSRTRFCEGGFHGGDFYDDSHSFFLSQKSGENFVEIDESDDDDALE